MRRSKTQHVYDERARAPFDGSTYRSSVLDDLALLEGLAFDARIVDVGCGRGFHIAELAQRGFHDVYGLDVSAASLLKSVTNLGPVLGDKVHLVHADVRDWNVSGYFDAAISFLACLGTENLERDQKYVASLRRLLRAGGKVWLSTFDRDRAAELVQNTSASYSADDLDPVTTNVSFDTQTHVLRIDQTCKSYGSPVVETFQLYSASELRKLFCDAGFSSVQASAHPKARAILLVEATA